MCGKRKMCIRDRPELFTVTSAEYEAIHSAWYKAIKVLPDYSIVHKQDFFITESYQTDTERDELSFLSRSFERHFNERPFLNHYCYLFLTKTTREMCIRDRVYISGFTRKAFIEHVRRILLAQS